MNSNETYVDQIRLGKYNIGGWAICKDYERHMSKVCPIQNNINCACYNEIMRINERGTMDLFQWGYVVNLGLKTR